MARDADKPQSDAEVNKSDESLNEKTLDTVSGGFWGPNANSPRCPKCGLQVPQGWEHSCSQTSTSTITRS